VRLEELGKLKKSNDFFENRTCDLSDLPLPFLGEGGIFINLERRLMVLKVKSLQ
jgi:hypothetical protein